MRQILRGQWFWFANKCGIIHIRFGSVNFSQMVNPHVPCYRKNPCRSCRSRGVKLFSFSPDLNHSFLDNFFCRLSISSLADYVCFDPWSKVIKHFTKCFTVFSCYPSEKFIHFNCRPLSENMTAGAFSTRNCW